MKLNKSYATNITALLFVGISFYLPTEVAVYVQSAALFALSGAITNTLAIHMLFNKVPLLYGSGIIVIKFEAFKKAIASMIMQEFFNQNTVDKFIASQTQDIDASKIIDAVDMDIAFIKLKEVVLDSSLGSMLGMFGGEKVLDSFKEPFESKMREALAQMASKEEFKTRIITTLSGNSESYIQKIQQLIDTRLDELTPVMVKELIEKIIHEHLGWLVVWGGVFGALIGLVSAAVFAL